MLTKQVAFSFIKEFDDRCVDIYTVADIQHFIEKKDSSFNNYLKGCFRSRFSIRLLNILTDKPYEAEIIKITSRRDAESFLLGSSLHKVLNCFTKCSIKTLCTIARTTNNETILNAMTKHHNARVRASVAKSIHLSQELKESLLKDTSKLVQNALLNNFRMTQNEKSLIIYQQLSNQKESETRKLIEDLSF